MELTTLLLTIIGAKKEEGYYPLKKEKEERKESKHIYSYNKLQTNGIINLIILEIQRSLCLCN